MNWPLTKQVVKRLRRQPTPAEAILWERLRGGGVHGLKFRGQHAIGSFIADFYCARPLLVIELDGGIHEFQKMRDRERQKYLERRGRAVLRFSNEEVLADLEGVVSRIVEAATLRTPSPDAGEGAGG